MRNRINMDPIMMTPGIGGYLSVKRSGRHGFIKLPKAVGSSCVRRVSRNLMHVGLVDAREIRTWTKAVAMRTPVPKCLQAKKMEGGIFRALNRLATTGNPAPARTVSIGYTCESGLQVCIPSNEDPKIKTNSMVNLLYILSPEGYSSIHRPTT